MHKRISSAARLAWFAVSILGASHSLLAQDDADAPAAAATSSELPTRAIEQITVTGERSLLTMRNEIERIEEDMYRRFNELNNSDELDIFCVSERRTTSHIIQRTCEPVFLTKLKKENAQSAVSEMRNAFTDEGMDPVLMEYGLNLIESESSLKSLASGQYEELSVEILRIAQEHPDYLEALLKIGELKTEYAAARKLQFGNE